MTGIQFKHTYQHIISIENLLAAWQEFLEGKRSRKDVQEFERNLMANIISLHRDLVTKIYRHGVYEAFKINDPKPRDIHKASVRDRLLHHAIYRILYPYFDKKFIFDSYSCRTGKGTHRAINRFREYGRKISRNHTRTAWVLKCDIRKFFASIDHDILRQILRKHIADEDVLWLLGRVVDSFHTEGRVGMGLPLGNLTSQLLVNIYMNEFDQFVKHNLKAKHYIRYADDFVFFHPDRNYLMSSIPQVSAFLETNLNISLHPNKLFLKTVSSGVDFLGWVHFPDHRVLRTSTTRRMFRRLAEHPTKETQASYLGMLRHGDGGKLQRKVEALEFC